MTVLRAQRVSFSFSDAVPLISDTEFQLEAGWTGLVGANGAGKSTLLRLLAGELAPSSGSIAIHPGPARVVLCPQSVEALSPAIAQFGGSYEATAHRLFGRLRLQPEALARWPSLSPGERKRWQIGAALFDEPDVLLLDEPTNHLDAMARRWLLGALEHFRGIGVVVSHDREVLESLTSRTLRAHAGAVRLHPGGYGQARLEWEAEREGRNAARREALDEQARLEARLDRARRDHAAATARVSAGNRMKDRYDSDARSLVARGRAESAAARHGRNVGIARRAAERQSERIGAFELDKTIGRSVFLDYARAPKPRLMTLDAPELLAGAARLLGPLHVDVAREDRIWLSGENGAGKSTLLRALLAGAQLPSERLLVLPQDLTAEEERAALDSVRALRGDQRGRVLSLVAALGVDPERLLASEQPSPGEARKLLIASGLGRHVWALVLDEPTNHLDLPSIERLEAALAAYPGALLLVTHDESFARACTGLRWHLAAGAISSASLS